MYNNSLLMAQSKPLPTPIISGDRKRREKGNRMAPLFTITRLKVFDEISGATHLRFVQPLLVRYDSIKKESQIR
jgi:hypothetical protein